MCSSYKTINIIRQSDISNHELSIFLNNISNEALVGYLIYSKLLINPNKLSKNKMVEIIINDRAIQANNDIDMVAVNINKCNVYNK